MTGGVMVMTGWLAGLTKTDTDKAIIWRDICIVRPLSLSSPLDSISGSDQSLRPLRSPAPRYRHQNLGSLKSLSYQEIIENLNRIN